MNPSDWVKAATLVTQHKQEAAMAEADQLSSMPLSQLAMDGSSPPVVDYGMHVPTATSTPTCTEVHMQSPQQKDSYQQILRGIPEGSLYPTLSLLSSQAVACQEEAQSLHDKVSKGLEKYLQDAEQHHALEVSYFDDNTTRMSEEPNLEDAGETLQSHKGNQVSSKQMSIEDINIARNAPESLRSDTGHTSRQHLPVCADADEKRQQIRTSEDVEQDANAQHRGGKQSVIDITREPIPIQSE